MLSRSARKCSRSGTPARRFVTERPSCVYAGNVMTISASVVHSAGDPGRMVHAATSSTTSDGGIRLRRRLSRIFQRAIAGSRLGTTAPLASRTVRQDPARDLPVAADPAVLAGGEAQIVVRVVVDDVDVGAERRPRERPFEEVVAEQRVVRHAPGERPFEGVDVVDALADVAALVEEILIDVGDGGRVRIDADVARKDPREPRAVGADDADRDARLENPVALGHALHRRVEARPVQRVRQRADHRPARLERQLRIAVERDDVFHRRQQAEIAELHRVAGVGGAAQQLVELVQLAALPLPSHPAPFAGVVGARAVEQEEAIGAVARVEDLDARLRRSQQRRVFRRLALGRVAEVGQQREVQVLIAVGEEADLEIVDERPGCAPRCR